MYLLIKGNIYDELNLAQTEIRADGLLAVYRGVTYSQLFPLLLLITSVRVTGSKQNHDPMCACQSAEVNTEY